jgi:hypothetical protein
VFSKKLSNKKVLLLGSAFDIVKLFFKSFSGFLKLSSFTLTFEIGFSSLP